MALLDRRGHTIPDRWRVIADDADLPGDVPAIVTLARLRAGIAPGRAAPLGVTLEPDAVVADIARDLPRLQLVTLHFNKFRDGRAFTQARVLREQFGFEGEIRAVGHVLPDQYLFLLRCGFSTVDVTDESRVARFAEALKQHSVAYQPALGGDAGANPLRRHLKAAS